MKSTRFESTYLSSLDASRQAAEALNEFLNTVGVDEITAMQIELCIVEMVNNAYEHAYGEQEGKPVVVSCELNDSSVGSTLQLEVVDRGERLSQQALEKALSKEFVEADPADDSTWETSGRGFTIVKSIMDSVRLTTDGDLNRFLMTKSLAPQTEL